MANKMPTGDRLSMKGFQGNLNFLLDAAQIIFNEHILLIYFITEGKNKEKMMATTTPTPRRPQQKTCSGSWGVQDPNPTTGLAFSGVHRRELGRDKSAPTHSLNTNPRAELVCVFLLRRKRDIRAGCWVGMWAHSAANLLSWPEP